MRWQHLTGLFLSRASLEAENLALRQQIIVLRRTAPKRLRFGVPILTTRSWQPIGLPSSNTLATLRNGQ
jgi:hypothetical protein